jgi:hypothetical protein
MVGNMEVGENDPTGYILLKSLAEQLQVTTDYPVRLTDDPHIQVREPELTSESRAHNYSKTARSDGVCDLFRC